MPAEFSVDSFFCYWLTPLAKNVSIHASSREREKKGTPEEHLCAPFGLFYLKSATAASTDKGLG